MPYVITKNMIKQIRDHLNMKQNKKNKHETIKNETQLNYETKKCLRDKN